MSVYEDDRLNIPEKYKNMSVSEIKAEKERLWEEISSRPRPKKKISSNKKKVVFKFN